MPLAAQIEQQLRLLLERGQLAAGARLPSIRRLAEQLGVSPNTVVVAYDRLVAEAALEARGKSGYFVSPWVRGGAETAALLEAGDEQDPVWIAQQSNDQPPGLLLGRLRSSQIHGREIAFIPREIRCFVTCHGEHRRVEIDPDHVDTATCQLDRHSACTTPGIKD